MNKMILLNSWQALTLLILFFTPLLTSAQSSIYIKICSYLHLSITDSITLLAIDTCGRELGIKNKQWLKTDSAEYLCTPIIEIDPASEPTDNIYFFALKFFYNNTDTLIEMDSVHISPNISINYEISIGRSFSTPARTDKSFSLKGITKNKSDFIYTRYKRSEAIIRNEGM